MNKTALQWLFEEWPILESQIPQHIKDKAFEMEKDQIVEAWIDGVSGWHFINSEHYYNEVYGGKL